MMILDLHRQGLSVTAIARRTGRDPKTIRKYIERGLELPAYGPRQVGRPNKIAPYLDYVRERVAALLTATRLTRELRERGYGGAYTAVKRFVAAIRPSDGCKPFEVRFETPSGHQAQVDFARFVTVFEDEPGITRIIWLFSMVPGHSRHIVARFGLHQDLQTLLRCHMAAFVAMGGVPIEILYDRMKMAVTGEDEQGTSSTTAHSWRWRSITASIHAPADRIEPRRRARGARINRWTRGGGRCGGAQDWLCKFIYADPTLTHGGRLPISTATRVRAPLAAQGCDVGLFHMRIAVRVPILGVPTQ